MALQAAYATDIQLEGCEVHATALGGHKPVREYRRLVSLRPGIGRR